MLGFSILLLEEFKNKLIMEYKICIPTYRRSNVIKEFAFKWLDIYKIDYNIVYLFVSDKIDYDDYKEKYPNMNIILTNTKNIGEKRNFIRNYFDEGEYIVSLDDSFCGLSKKEMNGYKLNDVLNFDELCRYSYNLMVEMKTKIWGINDIQNSLWMKNDISFKNGLIFGKCYGFINDKNDFLFTTCPNGLAEDCEISIRHYILFGSLIRHMDICLKKNLVGKIKGGIQSRMSSGDRLIESRKAHEYVADLFGGYCVWESGKTKLKYLSK
jgi:hypothetical protein